MRAFELEMEKGNPVQPTDLYMHDAKSYKPLAIVRALNIQAYQYIISEV